MTKLQPRHQHSLLCTLAAHLQELSPPAQELESKKSSFKKPFLLKEPNQELASDLLKSPQLSVKSLPLLSSCLPPSPLRVEDHSWINDHLSSIKEALHYPSTVTSLSTADKENPLFHLDTLLYLAFQHVRSRRSKVARYVRIGHSRLWFLGQYVVELALGEYFLLRYPREVTACLRERIFGLTGRKVLPHWIESSRLNDIIFADEEAKQADTKTRIRIVRQVSYILQSLIMNGINNDLVAVKDLTRVCNSAS